MGKDAWCVLKKQTESEASGSRKPVKSKTAGLDMSTSLSQGFSFSPEMANEFACHDFFAWVMVNSDPSHKNI